MEYFFEMLLRLFTLDIGWYVSAIMANLLWIFLVTVIMYYFLGGKNVLKGVILFFINAHLWIAVGNMYGIVIIAGGFLGVYYITKLATVMFSETIPGLRRWTILVASLQFFVLLIAYYAFLR